MAKQKPKQTTDRILLISKTIEFRVPSDMHDAEMDRLASAVEYELDMGLDAVGENVRAKFGGGRLEFNVTD